jgi:prolyl-tRNA synthetase
MKDLYSFDASTDDAFKTYRAVGNAYQRFFSDIKLPVVVAEASSGDMGGSLSHEYHLANAAGEDSIISCEECGYAANEEVAVAQPISSLAGKQKLTAGQSEARLQVWRGISKDRSTLVNAWYLNQRYQEASSSYINVSGSDLNMHVIKSLVPDIDTAIHDPLPFWKSLFGVSDLQNNRIQNIKQPLRLVNIVDVRVPGSIAEGVFSITSTFPHTPVGLEAILQHAQVINTSEQLGSRPNILRPIDGDLCPRCTTGSLRVQKALEVGHTFYLGARYSKPLGVTISVPPSTTIVRNLEDPSPSTSSRPNDVVPVQMGCYGIGVSRIIGAVAEHFSDKTGLNWPRAIAPYEVVVIPAEGLLEEVIPIFDMICGGGSLNDLDGRRIDAILDDRDQTFGWKIKDADLIGYPIIVVLGRDWKSRRHCEVQCRQLSLKVSVPVSELRRHLDKLLQEL